MAQMEYARFREAGWPIGSGSGESANKLVVEARLKGAGMHWEKKNVNPMLALRNAFCNARWEEVWGQIEGEQRRQMQVRRQERHKQRRPEALPWAVVTDENQAGSRKVHAEAVFQGAVRDHAADGRPAAAHPWRRAWSPRRQLEQVLAGEPARR